MSSKLFVANTIEDPDVQREMETAWRNIHELLPDHAPGVERKPPHLTLRYLGQADTDQDANPQQFMALDTALQGITHLLQPINLILGYVHTFPGVAWVSVGGTDEALQSLAHLAHQVDHAVQACVGNRLPPPARNYHFLPHLTLGKFDQHLTDLVDRNIADTQDPDQLPFTLQGIRVMRSWRDGNDGSIYSPNGRMACLGTTDDAHLHASPPHSLTGPSGAKAA